MKKTIKQWTCVITGSTSGVGLGIARGMAELGATVVISGRNKNTGIKTAERLMRETGNTNIEFRILDLSSFSSIHNFVHGLKEHYSSVELLSNNAAVLQRQAEITADGVEKTFQVNYLGHFLLTILLLDLLKNDEGGRIITVSGSPSILTFGKLDIQNLDSRKKYNFLKATLRAAYAKVAFSYKLSCLLDPQQVTSNTFHPGVIKSNLGRNLPEIIKLLFNLVEFFLPAISKTALYAAVSDDLDGISGAFISHQRIIDFNPKHDLDFYADFLWRQSFALTGIEAI
jgi:NAD(P)-dependent dehydrogenase (short-subunit alcohol dehydrogenase family)